MRTIKIILLLLTAALLLSACAAPNTAPTPAPTDIETAALQDQVEALTGKVEQLQDKISDLEQENQLLQSDSTVGASEDLSYLLDMISQSGQTVVSYPALITAISGSGDEFTLQVDRLEYNPDYEPGAPGDETYLVNAAAEPENIQADRFTYVHYGDYLLPELDESFGDYLTGNGMQFTVYLLGDRVIFLDEILVP